MCAVRALWISCCNHFYLLNYVKPFFYPSSVSLFISPSLLLALCHGLVFFFTITGTIKAYRDAAAISTRAGRYQPETAMLEIVAPNGCWEIKYSENWVLTKGTIWGKRCSCFKNKHKALSTLRSVLLPFSMPSLVSVRGTLQLTSYKAFLLSSPPLFQAHNFLRTFPEFQ